MAGEEVFGGLGVCNGDGENPIFESLHYRPVGVVVDDDECGLGSERSQLIYTGMGTLVGRGVWVVILPGMRPSCCSVGNVLWWLVCHS